MTITLRLPYSYIFKLIRLSITLQLHYSKLSEYKLRNIKKGGYSPCSCLDTLSNRKQKHFNRKR